MIDALIVVTCLISIGSNVLVLRAKGLLHPIDRLRRRERTPRPPSLTKLA